MKDFGYIKNIKESLDRALSKREVNQVRYIYEQLDKLRASEDVKKDASRLKMLLGTQVRNAPYAIKVDLFDGYKKLDRFIQEV